MNESVCSEFIHHLDQDGRLDCDHAPEHIKLWLEDLNLPMDLLRFMQWSWPQSDGNITHIRVLSSNSIYSDESTPALVAYKFLNVGYAPNGDFFVIDFSTESCIPGFIALGEWSPFSDDLEDPRPFFQPLARSLDSFLYRALEGKYIPTDYYAASDFNEFLSQEHSNAEQADAGNRGKPGA